MKVLLVAHAVAGGGAQEVCRAWAGALAAEHDVEILVLDSSSGARAAIDALPPGVRVVCLADLGITSHRGRIAYLRDHTARERFEAVISLETYPNLLSLVAVRRARRIISEHNIPSVLLPMEGLAKRLQLFLARLLYRRATYVVCVSHAVATDIRCNFGVASHRTVVLPNGVLPGAAALVPPAVDADVSVTLLVPARLAPQKRPDYCVAIAEEVARRGATVALVWIGDEPPGDRPLTAALRSDRVKVSHLAWRDDWFVEADPSTVVLLGSAYEGLGNVLIKAAERGIPAVAGSNALGCADAVIPGVTGCLAEVDSVESYADAVLAAARLDATNPLESWLQQFSTDTTGRKLNNLLRRS